MKELKRVSITIVLVLFISPLAAFANSNSSINNSNELYVSEMDVETNSKKNTIIKVLGKLLINVVGNKPLGNNPGRVVDHGHSYYVTHKNVKFNSGSIKTTVRKNLTTYGQDIIRAFMQKNQLFASKAFIHIYNGGRDPVRNRSVSSGQVVEYKIPGGYNSKYNNYYIHYGSSYSDNWYPRMWYIRSSEPCIPCLPTSSSNAEDSNLVMKDNQIYIKQTIISATDKTSRNEKDKFTMNDLFTEFYNVSTEELSNQTKTLSPGNDVIMVDRIMDLYYHEDDNYTELKFHSTYSDPEYHIIRFKGDLTNDYDAGELLKLKFKLVKTAKINGNTFVDLDYNLHVDKTGEFPKIDSFMK